MTEVPYEFFDAYVPFKPPKISFHDSGLSAKHNYACPVCKTTKAIYSINLDIFLPCDTCANAGWKLVRRKSWMPKWLRRRIDG